MRKKRALFLVFCIAALCSLLVVLLHPAPIDRQRVLANAVDFCKKLDAWEHLLLLDVIYRRFGIDEFADALQRYDQILSLSPQDAPLMRVLRRIADHDNPLQPGDLEKVNDRINRLIVTALYCDRLGLPEDYPEMLVQAASEGGESLTHVLLAWIWIQESDHEVSLPEGFTSQLYRANADLINDDTVVNDLEIEAGALLFLAGQGALVDNAFVERLSAVQNFDGGWLDSSDTPGASSAHSTVLALLLLLHVEYPSDSYPPMLAPPSL